MFRGETRGLRELSVFRSRNAPVPKTDPGMQLALPEQRPRLRSLCSSQHFHSDVVRSTVTGLVVPGFLWGLRNWSPGLKWWLEGGAKARSHRRGPVSPRMGLGHGVARRALWGRLQGSAPGRLGWRTAPLSTGGGSRGAGWAGTEGWALTWVTHGGLGQYSPETTGGPRGASPQKGTFFPFLPQVGDAAAATVQGSGGLAPGSAASLSSSATKWYLKDCNHGVSVSQLL